ncbi:MAG: hypothetical protein WDO74_31430 [Pseudomonadota bacterium]
MSRVGENGVADEYCVEAKQWQAALQEARKLRGDTGALSKFSIELLDRGYRAVDPSLKLRYLINEAPADAPLTGSGESSKKNGNKADASGKHRLVESLAPSAYATSLAPTPFTTSLAPPATSSAVPRPTSYPAPRPNSVAPARVLSADPPRPSQLVVPDDPVPPAPPLPGSFGLAPQSFAPRVPLFELVRQRAEEPRPDSPITYREFAYAVEPGRTRGEIEALLQDRYQATLATIEDRPPGKFVQLAVFDHVFKRRPERPPLATFAWKDWRGAPVMAFPGFGEEAMGPISRVPAARDSLLPPSNGSPASVAPEAPNSAALPLPPSLAPASSASAVPAAASGSVVPSAPLVPMAPVVIASVPPAPAKTVERASAPVLEAEIPKAAPAPVVEAEIPIAEAAPAAAVDVEFPIEEAARAPLVEATVSIVEGARAPVVEAPISIVEGARAPVVEAPAPLVEAARAPSFELTFEAAPSDAAKAAPAPSNPASSERASRPRMASEGRRRAGEDLIGELFEIMHELHFAHDVAAGSEFVLSVLDELLPCEGVLIHVFDINTGHFVVVRAKGPNANAVLLQRMSDQDPLVRSVMRSAHAVSVKNALDDARFTGPRWQALAVTPRTALCGGVQLSGRYLGLIEVANPHGNIPFHQSELNALDYICQQFAEFLSKKPIVLSADVVLSRV